MQVGTRYNDALDAFRISDKAATLIMEIGFDEIATATSFIDYISAKYGVSKSGAWYCLKKLKKAGIVEFTERGEQYKPLSLTAKGVELFRQFRSITVRVEDETGQQDRRIMVSVER
jgi:DNA-binding PadR family transcriptional regulator